ncbi:MAG: hypothetical protein ACTTKZ_01730 [Bacteroides sp.]|jgi:hypothetical protein
MVAGKSDTKKRIIISYEKLSEELLELFLQTYPHGYAEAAMPVTKPNGEVIYVVRLETEEVSYLVKVDVKIDDGDFEEEESNFSEEDEPIESAEQFADEKEDEDSDFD